MNQNIDRSHRSKLESVFAAYAALVDSISQHEIQCNPQLHKNIRLVRRQMELIRELNESFEYCLPRIS